MAILEALQEAFKQADTDIRVLNVEENCLQRLKKQYHVDDQSLFGTILTRTGGIIVDNWLRIYGSGEIDFTGRNETYGAFGVLLVAEDVAGGVFGLDDSGTLLYFSPDSLEWEWMDITYNRFVQWATSAERMNLFYETFRWKNWKDDIALISSGQAISFVPPLWAKPQKGERSKRIVPLNDVLNLELELSRLL